MLELFNNLIQLVGVLVLIIIVMILLIFVIMFPIEMTKQIKNGGKKNDRSRSNKRIQW